MLITHSSQPRKALLPEQVARQIVMIAHKIENTTDVELIDISPDSIEFMLDPSKKAQELAIQKLGKNIILKINNLDPELRQRYSGIINLKRSGLFR